MTKLSRETILKLANLSRLKLTEAEVEHFRVELTAILDYVSVLDGVNTLGLQPTYQLTGLKNVVRPDEANDYQAKATDLLKLAPAIDRNQFKVKRVLK
ncbi:Asp-tRNA(Asn)/Glu-tRNA(Gln) amidotransferase subunit GatC [Candidatus Saccharibacteria bacterium]|nr:Asp-tRNA(Asn)/Glu-tRNA(Gln) amidotransferase subunit GatC [Candidatus Saccharibacteria bacterium]